MALSSAPSARRAHGGPSHAASALASEARVKPKGALAHMRETLFAPATDTAPFRGFKAPAVEASFPHRVRLKELRLPRLPGLHEGPAPIHPRRDGGPRHGSELAIREHRAREAAALDSMWIAGFMDAASPRGAVRARRRMEDAEEDAKLSSEFRRLLETVRAWRREEGGDAVDDAHPLVKENARILSVLLASRKRRGAAGMPMKSSSLDKLLLLQRLEVQAAIILQRAYRRVLRRRFWRRFTVETKAVSTIQRVWYGHAERMRYQRYRAIANFVALRVQSWWRGTTTRREVKEDMQFHHAAAVDVQRVFRGHLARQRARQERHQRRVVRLQAWWRGVRGRARADRTYFDTMVSRIQTRVRVHLARRWYRRQKERFFLAATSIQRAVRGHLARQQRNRALWAHESAARKHVVRIMVAETRCIESEHASQIKKREYLLADNARVLADDAWSAACEHVRSVEVDYVRAVSERNAAAADADEELTARFTSDINRLRQSVTDAKAAALFDVALPRRDTKGQLSDLAERIADLEHRMMRLQLRINDDRGDILQRDSAMERAQTRRHEKMAVADEHRKWAIPLVTENGKPDLRARKAAEDIIRAHKRRIRVQKAQRDAAAAHIASAMTRQRADRHEDDDGVTPMRFSLASSNILALVPKSHGWRGGMPSVDPSSQFAARRLGIHVGGPQHLSHAHPTPDSGKGTGAAVEDSVQAARSTSDQVLALREAIAAQLAALEAQQSKLTISNGQRAGHLHTIDRVPQLQDVSHEVENATTSPPAPVLRLTDAVRGLVDFADMQRDAHGLPDQLVVPGLHSADPRAVGEGLRASVGKRIKKRHLRDGRRELNDLAHASNTRRFGGTGDAAERTGSALVTSPSSLQALRSEAPPTLDPMNMAPGAFADWIVGQAAADGSAAATSGGARHESAAAAAAVGVYGTRYLRTAVKSTPLQAYEAERVAMMAADATAVGVSHPSAGRHVAFAAAESNESPSMSLPASLTAAPQRAEHDAFARVNQLMSVLSAFSGEAEVTQYGALLKPAMDGMSRMMLHVMASDATAGAVDRVAEKFKTREAEIHKEMKARTRAANEADGLVMESLEPSLLLPPHRTPTFLPATPAPPSTAHGQRQPSVPVTLPAVYTARRFAPQSLQQTAAAAPPAAAPSRSPNHGRFYAQYKRRAQRVAEDLAAIAKDAAKGRSRATPTPSRAAPPPTSRKKATVRASAQAASRVAVGFDLTQAVDGELLEPTLVAMASPSSPAADAPITWHAAEVSKSERLGAAAISKRASVPWHLLEQMEAERGTLLS